MREWIGWLEEEARAREEEERRKREPVEIVFVNDWREIPDEGGVGSESAVRSAAELAIGSGERFRGSVRGCTLCAKRSGSPGT